MKSALTSSNIRPFFIPQPATNNRTFSFSLTNTTYRTRCSISMANTIKTYHLSNLTQTQLLSLKSRPRIDFTSIFNVVNPIVDDVHNKGDEAVKQYTSRFDKVDLDKIVELVSDLPDP
ncbi:histidinol dehydrogenase chloroplastic-like, partial [Trifolium pratense]